MLLGFWVDGWKLQYAHALVSLLGAFMSIYVMQLWSRGEIIANEHPLITHARRLALMIMALALIWSVSYAADKEWSPWPADFLTNVAVDMILGVTIVASRMRRFRLDRQTKASH